MLEWWQAAVLALIQGITEFLPISSSGHLILAPHLFGWPDQGLSFDIAANTGTLFAVLIYFRRDVGEMIVGFLRSLRERSVVGNPAGLLAWEVGLSTIPAGLVGLTFKEQIATAARDPLVIGTTAIVFGILMWWADHTGSRSRDLGQLSWSDVIIIACAQALALIPGTSRSGITMTAGLARGLTRETAARFSFLMSVPIGVLAGVLDLVDLIRADLTPNDWQLLGVGTLGSALAGYFVIDWLLGWLRRQSLTVFAIYRIILGCVIFALVI